MMVVVPARSVGVSVRNLVGESGANVGDSDLEVQSLSGQRMIGV